MNIQAVYPEVSQFANGKSAYRCGFYTAALQAAAGKTTPTHTADWVNSEADSLYTRFEGPDTANNINGISITDWHAILDLLGVHWANVGTDSNTIHAQLEQEKAVCVTIPETSVYDLDLDRRNPYSWTPAGNHIITIVGYDSPDNAWLCLDTANIAPTGERPWPRKYYLPWLKISLATAITFAWEINKVQTYTIKEGDNSWAIASSHHVSLAQFLGWNLATLDQAAEERGRVNSQEGSLIWAGTVVRVG